MNEQLAIYLWSISEKVQFLFLITGISGFTLWGVCRAKFLSVEEKWSITNSVIYNVILIFFMILILIGNLIPNKKDIALIFAYPHIKTGVTKNTASSQMNNLIKASDLYLQKIFTDLEKNK